MHAIVARVIFGCSFYLNLNNQTKTTKNDHACWKCPRINHYSKHQIHHDYNFNKYNPKGEWYKINMCEGYSKNMMTWGKPYYNNWGRSYYNNGGRPCRSVYNLRPLATRGGALSQPHFGLSGRMKLPLPKLGIWSPSGLPNV